MEDEYSLPIYPKRDLTITHGKGALLYADDGTRYIDAIAGWGSANIGHANPVIIDAIRTQAERLITCPGILYNDIRARAMEKLVAITPDGLNRVFFTNSGTESVEAAMKMAMLSTGKSHFISAMKAFHGRTMGSLQLTHKKKYKSDYMVLMQADQVTFVPFNKIDSLKSAIRSDTAAIILEVIQGEGGINIGENSYFQEVRRLADEYDIILIIDEVQTGFGRTGHLFAIEGVNIVPDILCLAKSIAGGIPMGAIVTSNRISGGVGKHGSTFGGNPLACAAFLASMRFIEENNLVTSSREKGEYLSTELSKVLAHHPQVRSVRGKGLMIAIELKVSNQQFIRELTNQGLLTIPTGKTIIRLLPPLVISYKLIDEMIEIISRVFN